MNLFAVALAAIAGMGVGFLWYSPSLFGRLWMAEMGLSSKQMDKSKKSMGPMYALSLAAALITAAVFYLFGGEFELAFMVWLGFVMPVQLTDVIFGGRSWKLFAVNTGYQLASLLAMAAVYSFLA